MYSSLTNLVKLSPNHSGKRTKPIDRITPHCFVGQVTIERIGKEFANTSKNASCNYGIGKDGKIVCVVEEENRSWCSSSNANDQRAITIECASDASSPYAFNLQVYQALVDLTVDIMKRYGKDTLVYIPTKTKAVNYKCAENEMQLTFHRWFASKACPGDWFVLKASEFTDEVNRLLNGTVTPSKPTLVEEPVYVYPHLGDGLYKIARRYNITIDEIKRLNPDIKPPMYLVRMGRKVRIK